MKIKSYHPLHLKCRRVLMVEYAPLPKWFLILFSPALTVIQTEVSQIQKVMTELREPIDFVLFSKQHLISEKSLFKADLAWLKKTHPSVPLVASSDEEIKLIRNYKPKTTAIKKKS